MPKPPSTFTPEQLLLDYPPDVREITQALRQLIKDTVPAATETAYPHWRALGYRHPTAGYFAALFPQPAAVNFTFEWGALLPDPHRLLHPGGRQVSYVPITTLEHLPVPALQDLLHAALSLPDTRLAKQALLRNKQ